MYLPFNYLISLYNQIPWKNSLPSLPVCPPFTLQLYWNHWLNIQFKRLGQSSHLTSLRFSIFSSFLMSLTALCFSSLTSYLFFFLSFESFSSPSCQDSISLLPILYLFLGAVSTDQWFLLPPRRQWLTQPCLLLRPRCLVQPQEPTAKWMPLFGYHTAFIHLSKTWASYETILLLLFCVQNWWMALPVA